MVIFPQRIPRYIGLIWLIQSIQAIFYAYLKIGKRTVITRIVPGTNSAGRLRLTTMLSHVGHFAMIPLESHVNK